MKKVMKKVLALLFAFGILLTGAAGAAAAEDGALILPEEPSQPCGCYVEVEEPVYREVESGGDIQTFSVGEYDREEAARAIRDGMVAYRTEFDVSACHIPLDQFQGLWQHTHDRYGELFHIAEIDKVTYNAQKLVVEIYVKYSMSAEEYAAQKQVFDEKIDAILSQIEPTWTDLQKVLFVHDYLAANFEYDVEGLDANDPIYDSYQFLTTGTGVCQAYTLTCATIMDRLGIPVSYVRSNELKHIWNKVRVDGQWYQMDITHDDPVADSLGAVRHEQFMVSDDKMKEIKGKDDMVYGIEDPCTDTSYENWFWKETTSPFVYDKSAGIWYCVCSGATNNGLYQWGGELNQCTLVEKVSSFEGWISDGKPSSFAAGLALYHGSLYFSAPDDVYQYDLKTKELKKFEIVTDYYETDRVYGLRISGNILSYDYRTAESGWTRTIKTIELSPYFNVEDIYDWYAEDGVVYLRIPEETQQTAVMVAWYDGSMLANIQMYTSPGEFQSAGADGLSCKIMALAQNDCRPLCGAVEIEATGTASEDAA